MLFQGLGCTVRGRQSPAGLERLPPRFAIALVAVTVFPAEQYQAPRSWTERAYPNLSYFHEVDKGGHFAVWEERQLFSEELRDAFWPLRQ